MWQRRAPEALPESRLIKAAEIIAEHLELSEESQVGALKHDGFDEGEAWRLVMLLPMAFSRPVLEALGVRHFARHISAQASDGSWVRAPLMRQPEYVAALKLARVHRNIGVMDHEVFKRIAGSCSNIDAASRALNEGADIAGATVASALVGPQAAVHLLR